MRTTVQKPQQTSRKESSDFTGTRSVSPLSLMHPPLHSGPALYDQSRNSLLPPNAKSLCHGPDLLGARFSTHDTNRMAPDNEPSTYVQTKLTVNTPGDSYEQEADRIADEVMRMPEGRIQTAPT